MDENSVPQHLRFPRTLNKNQWMIYLGRPLSWKEMYIIEEVKSEKYMNNQLDELYQHCLSNDLFVPILTDLDGNCLFESLVYFNIADSIESLRCSLSYLMYIFKDLKDFLPGVDLSLGEMFNFTNDIETVACITKNNETNEKEVAFYKYTYETMCQDLSNMHSWSKLPTEIIMRMMSLLFNIEFIVLHNNTGHFSNINVYSEIPEEDRPPMQKIFLGLIGESHYVPIDVLAQDEEIDPMYYTDSKRKFIFWARKKEALKISEYQDRLRRIKYYHLNSLNSDSDNSDDGGNGRNGKNGNENSTMVGINTEAVLNAQTFDTLNSDNNGQQNEQKTVANLIDFSDSPPEYNKNTGTDKSSQSVMNHNYNLKHKSSHEAPMA